MKLWPYFNRKQKSEDSLQNNKDKTIIEIISGKYMTQDFGYEPNKQEVNVEGMLVDGPLTRQEGGTHYKNMAIQPVEYCHANKMNICESNVIKYVSRHRNKNGIEDLKKARHFIDLLAHLEYGVNLKSEDN